MAAYVMGVSAMASIAYGCWLWNEALGFVVGGILVMSLAVELRLPRRTADLARRGP